MEIVIYEQKKSFANKKCCERKSEKSWKAWTISTIVEQTFESRNFRDSE